MAIAYVKATVKNVFQNGKAAGVVESFQKRDGTTGEQRYTAWFDQEHGLSEGSYGEFSGLLSAKVKDFERQDGSTGHAAEIHLNSARFKAIETEDTPF